MLYFIIGIVVFLIFIFLRDKSDEVSKVKSYGGMMGKYSILISGLSDYPGTKVEQTSSTSVWILTRDRLVSTEFRINHGFSDFTVFWTHQSYAFGKHHLRWTFPEYMSQHSATNVIMNEIEEYSIKMISKTL
ncbi:hypothetical protein [Pedobacter sp. SL55]|uniref:hypothetical protein n=1 Tax=Pedobacter sp. SL55 TaxID=2995161 RepID=UPI00226D6EEB|nr:hypothetical protein [Pedobacter sp. SL55]WAC40906.1 hypothetical protein OVA16_00515 [Pedobacter sp. SL55]